MRTIATVLGDNVADEKPITVIDRRASSLENPIAVFVKGGTRTDASDREIEENFQDAEQRRDQQAAERRASVTTADAAVDEGRPLMVTNPLTSNSDVPRAYILLKYLTRSGEDTGGRALADIVIGTNPDKPAEVMLILVCPKCLETKEHQDQCQIQISQGNKKVEFVAGAGKPMFRFDKGFGFEEYHSAGMVMETEPFTCPQCSWRARIHKNRVWPE